MEDGLSRTQLEELYLPPADKFVIVDNDDNGLFATRGHALAPGRTT